MSGGPDSLALLLLAHAACPEDIAAATVDHGLRPDSAAEAKMVADLCGSLGIPHTSLKVTVKPGNMQSVARDARYAALGEWHDAANVAAIMTAHHADDQAETFLMRLNRGSGLGGLSSIRPMTTIPVHGGTLYRPLLQWRKAELEAIVAAAGIEPVRDPSNEDDRFDRARMRKILVDADWLDVTAIAQSAAHLERAQSTFELLAQDEWNGQVKRIGKRYVYRPSSPDQVQLLVMERVISALGSSDGSKVSRSAIDRLRNRLLAGQSGNLGGVLVTPVGDAWRFEKEPPRNSTA